MPSTMRKKRKTKSSWEHVALEAQCARDQSIRDVGFNITLPAKLPGNVTDLPKTLLSGVQLNITSLSIEEVVQLAGKGDISVRDIVHAFMCRAVVAQQSTNCITELLPSRALSRAAALDATLARNPDTTKGPLYGLPVSIKSHIGIAGHHIPSGYVALWSKVAPADALVVQILERAGAVVHARTTEPQSMMQLECASNLYGRTTNPHNTSLSSGGSSGGEAALVAMRGSLLGVGSDVGGSIRVPAAACGVYGLKPTAFRVPTRGWSSTPPGADPIPTVLGPMCVSLSGVELFMKTVLDAQPWLQEPSLVPMPWREDVKVRPTKDKRLRFGIMRHDGVVTPHPPVSRVLNEFAARIATLENVEVVDVKPYKHDEAWAIVSSLYFTDGGRADIDLMEQSGEPMLPLTEWIIKQNPCVKTLTREELEYWLEEREEFRLEYSDHWNKTGVWDEAIGRWEGCVDAFVCPVAPWVATAHGTAKYWTYTAIWNLLDYPALAFPAGRANQEEDALEQDKRFLSQLDRETWNMYHPEVYHDMPVGLQLVARRFEDEKLVRILQFLERSNTTV